MRKLYLLLITASLWINANGQGLPDLSGLGLPLDSLSILNGVLPQEPMGERYKDPVFSELVYAPGIFYGSADILVDSLTLVPNAYPLFMDVYMPLLDVLNTETRPVIVLAFGGSFVYGARVSPDIVQLCTRFAQLGYVTVSIDYRLTDELLINPSHDNAYRAVSKAMHDMKGAVRFLRMQADSLGNPLNIDTDKIIVGGVSAGAFGALHAAYLDRVEEVPVEFWDVLEQTGGIEGNSGNESYSSEVFACVNLCGALGKAEWLEMGDVPLVSLHGDEDGTVPYDNDTIRALDVNYPVSGSAAIHRRADEVGVRNAFYTFKGADHTPFILPSIIGPSEMAYMDTTFEFTRDFLFGVVTGNSGTAVNELDNDLDFSVSPNPCDDFVLLPDFYANFNEYKLVNASGKVVKQGKTAARLNVSDIDNGTYILSLIGTKNQSKSARLVIQH